VGGHQRDLSFCLLNIGATSRGTQSVEAVDNEIRLGSGFLHQIQTADSVPVGFGQRVRGRQIAFPLSSAFAIAQRARPAEGITAAFRAIQRNVLVLPADSAREATIQMETQVFNGQHVVGGGSSRISHLVGRSSGIVVALFQTGRPL